MCRIKFNETNHRTAIDYPVLPGVDFGCCGKISDLSIVFKWKMLSVSVAGFICWPVSSTGKLDCREYSQLARVATSDAADARDG